MHRSYATCARLINPSSSVLEHPSCGKHPRSRPCHRLLHFFSESAGAWYSCSSSSFSASHLFFIMSSCFSFQSEGMTLQQSHGHLPSQAPFVPRPFMKGIIGSACRDLADCAITAWACAPGARGTIAMSSIAIALSECLVFAVDRVGEARTKRRARAHGAPCAPELGSEHTTNAIECTLQ